MVNQNKLLVIGLLFVLVLIALLWIIPNFTRNTKSQITPSATSSRRFKPISSAATKNWQTYVNEEYLFSFKYPADLLSGFKEEKRENEAVTLSTNNIEGSDKKALTKESTPLTIQIEMSAWKYSGSLDQFLKEKFIPKYIAATAQREPITIAGAKGCSITTSPQPFKLPVIATYNNFVKRQNFIYNFSLKAPTQGEMNASQELLDQIISTVTFLDKKPNYPNKNIHLESKQI